MNHSEMPSSKNTLMKPFWFVTLTLLAALATTSCDKSKRYSETLDLWNDVVPPPASPFTTMTDVEKPIVEYWKPREKTSDACVIVCPGGGYYFIAPEHENDKIAQYFTERGVTTVVLRYRVPNREEPRREGIPKHLAAWQDAQRCVRLVRAHAKEWGIDPEKIGIMGFSAGGHLALMTATTSLTNSYEPIDEIDKLSASVNFAVPVYPAYVLEDGADEPNTGKGNDSKLVGDFAFDEKTPPMCFIHGDDDQYSPMGSVAVYEKLRQLEIPAELHIYANVGHGFGGNPTDDHLGDWLNRVYNWMQTMGF